MTGKMHDDKSADFSVASDDWAELVPHSPISNRATSTSNHSEIEKRRRDRMNELMGQLAALIPATFSRKLDKLSVLRLALDHISTMNPLTGEELSFDSCAKHIISSDLLTHIKKKIEHFMAVVDALSGKILYASDEMYKFLGSDLLARNWYEILHPVDAAIFKKESSTECYKNVYANDSVYEAVSSSTGHYKQKTGWNMGLKRSFPCRLRVFSSNDSSPCEQNYECFHCYGLLREINKPTMIMLLVKMLPSGLEEQFQITVTPKGQVVHCGSGLPFILKRLPQDLSGCCYYDLIHEGDLLDVAYHHKQVLSMGDSRRTSYRIRAMNKKCIKVDATWIPFINPWNLKTQFIIIDHQSNSLKCDEESSPEQSVLRQLLSNKRLKRNNQEMATELTVLGTARLGDSVVEEAL